MLPINMSITPFVISLDLPANQSSGLIYLRNTSAWGTKRVLLSMEVESILPWAEFQVPAISAVHILGCQTQIFADFLSTQCLNPKE